MCRCDLDFSGVLRFVEECTKRTTRHENEALAAYGQGLYPERFRMHPNCYGNK